MKRYGVRPSVCLFHSPAAAACGGFAAVRPAGRRYRSIAVRPAPQQHGAAAANAGSATLSADVEAAVNTDLFYCTLAIKTRQRRAKIAPAALAIVVAALRNPSATLDFHSAVLIKHRFVTDRQTDRHRDGHRAKIYCAGSKDVVGVVEAIWRRACVKYYGMFVAHTAQ